MMVVSQLGYLRLASPRIDEWEHLTSNIYGADVERSDDDSQLTIRLDERAFRVKIDRADSEKVLGIGWETPNKTKFEEAVSRIKNAGIQVDVVARDVAHDAGVAALAYFTDPGGFACELYYGQHVSQRGLRYGRSISGFNAGSLGLGHAVLVADDPETCVEFYTEVLGFKISDYIEFAGAFMTFLHCNPRHHSLALLAPAFGYKAGDIFHFMMEVNSIDDVGTAYEMVLDQDLPITLTLGRHSNDKMTSFYAQGPSGFDVEYGTGGVLIHDEDEWDVVSYSSPKLWGHSTSK